ncbi:MAG: primosomal protein N' [bacterium]|nr:primosomal protein N' [bacterium]
MDLIEVIVFLPVEGTYYYSVPERFSSFVEVGKRVRVPFRNRKVTGFIVRKDIKIESADYEIKDIIDILDDKPVLTPRMLDLTKWVAEYYLCPFGEVLKSAFPDSNPRRARLIQSENDTFIKKIYPSNLNPYQKGALESIGNFVKESRFSVFLLHGVGEFEVYLQAIRDVVRKGKGVIVLIPEISEDGLTIERFKEAFPNKIVILHSKTLKSERSQRLKRIQKEEGIIIIGTRQAIFSPVPNLGLIVILEEAEVTYKQKGLPMFNARDVAIMRGKIEDVPVLLVSTTPSIESYYKAKKRKYYYFNLPTDDGETPRVKIIDMRKEWRDNKGILSDYLKKAIEDRLGKKEQVILFLNRRGLARFIQCRECGHVLTCPNCEISLTYHFDKSCRCHYCNWKTPAPSYCPNCKGYEITHFGFGTQHVEQELKWLFPKGKVVRVDTDSCKSKKVFESTIDEFRINRKIDILIGTQMVIKDLEFQGVSLIGVISGDTLFNLPDFRAGERAYSLLTQIVRMVRKGEVVIQSYNPAHYVIRGVKTGDFHAFYRKEIVSRKRFMYPPFAHIVNIIIKGKDEKEVIKVATNLGDCLRADNHFNIRILGPVPSIISKIKGRFRFQIILKTKKPSDARKLLTKSLYEISIPSTTSINIDVDPIEMM